MPAIHTETGRPGIYCIDQAGFNFAVDIPAYVGIIGANTWQA